jgi:N-methylhydantoinase A
MNLSIEAAAAGILRVINAKMVKGITARTTQKGLDVREFALMAFGGAGALHAAEIAMELGMDRVVVPPLAGNLSALGLLVADARHDYVQTIMLSESDVEPAQIEAVLADLRVCGFKQLEAEGIPADSMEFVYSADLRFEGQSYDLNVLMPRGEGISKDDLSQVVSDFHRLHEQIYAFEAVDEVTEWVNLRVIAVGKSQAFALPKRPAVSGTSASQAKHTRRVYFFDKGYIDVPVYERESLLSGAQLAGPCLIEEVISTTLLPPGWKLSVDPIGNLLLNRAN